MKKLIEALLNEYKKPLPYAPSTAPFWDDEHISKGMLAAHLNPNWDAATRPLGFVDKSVEWINSKYPASKHPYLLDLGCGPGIYAEKFNSIGYKVTGVDLSKRSIEYALQKAKENNSDITYINKSYTEMDFDKKYDVITLIYCDYPVIPTEQRKLLLKNIKSSLNENGAFIFDVFTPNNYEFDKESTEWYMESDSGFWSDKPHLCLGRHFIYEDEIRLDETIVITEEKHEVYRVWDKAFTRESISQELKEAGFTSIEFYSDVAGTEYEDETKVLGIVAK
jgi:SAM-dependent methyltransferase